MSFRMKLRKEKFKFVNNHFQYTISVLYFALQAV